MNKNVKLQQATRSRLERLKELSFEELSTLPEILEDLDGEVKVTTYRDLLPDGRLRIVVQGYLHRILGIGSITAEGFIVGSDGVHASVPEEMIWDFM